MRTIIKNYFLLTKPKIMILVVFSGLTALIMEGSLLTQPARFFLAIVALYLTGGSANALNNFFERDIDAKMERTSKKRPLPKGLIKPYQALLFSIIIGLGGVGLFAFEFNWLSAVLSLATILFYSLFYTLVLKPSTSQNIVIGSAAGAMAPVGVWAAASGSIDITPWTLFLIVFFWSPPHFWALAYSFADDYRKVELPMLPIVKGEKATYNQIFYYSLILFFASLTPFIASAGLFYFFSALILGIIFIFRAFKARKTRSKKLVWGVFSYSIIYLFGIFTALIFDVFINIRFLN